MAVDRTIEINGKGTYAIQLIRERVVISCLAGTLWMTREADPGDYVLRTGESVSLAGSGRVVIFGLEDGRFHVGRYFGKSPEGIADFRQTQCRISPCQ